METPVEIRYAGVVVARAETVRHTDKGGVDLFVPMAEPLPAGTLVSVGEAAQARIEKVIESADASVAGVYLRMVDAQEAARPWTPAFKEAELPPSPAPERLPVVVAAKTADPISARADRHATVVLGGAPPVDDGDGRRQATIVVSVAPPAETPSEPRVAPVPKVKMADEPSERSGPVAAAPPPTAALHEDARPSTIIVEADASTADGETEEKPTIPTRVSGSEEQGSAEELPPARPLPNDARRRTRTRRKTQR